MDEKHTGCGGGGTRPSGAGHGKGATVYSSTTSLLEGRRSISQTVVWGDKIVHVQSLPTRARGGGRYSIVTAV